MDGRNFDGSILCDLARTLHFVFTTVTLRRQVAYIFFIISIFRAIILECSRIHLPQECDGSFFILK
jgi:hypothetical protein